ncbi:MAG: DUF3177 family protein, partial [Microcystaceae cyanobacterium]
MEQVWFRPLVWLDYRLAILLLFMIPLVLIIWSLVRKAEAVERLLIIYWRVASLFLITIYLMVPSWPVGFLTGFGAKVLIPIALWFWVDVNDEIKDSPPSVFKL